MSNTIEAQRRIRELGAEAQAVLSNKSFSNTVKKAKLDGLQAELEQHKATLSLHQKSAALMAGGESIDSPYAAAAGSPTTKGISGQAPSLVLDPEQQLALFKSVQDRMPFVTKAAVTTGNLDPALYPSQFLPPVLAAREPSRILDLLPVTATDAALIEYYVTTGTAAAAAVAEGAQKPESGISFTKAQAGVTKLAHWMQVTEEALTDFAPFQQLLSADMIAGLIDSENNELLNALGTGASKFKGLLQVAGTQSYTRVTGDTILDAIEIAGSQLRAAGRFTDPDGIVMHPLDYSKARRTKSTTNEYIAGDPTQAGPQSLWGTRVVLTSEIPQGKAVVANFAKSCQVWVREGLSVRTNAYGSGFRSNEVEVIAEERLSLGVLAPSALSVVTIADPA